MGLGKKGEATPLVLEQQQRLWGDFRGLGKAAPTKWYSKSNTEVKPGQDMGVLGWRPGGHWFFLFLVFRAVATAYGGSQARGQIGTVAAGLRHSHSNIRSEPCL